MNNNLIRNEIEVGIPALSDLQVNNGVQIVEGRRINYHLDNTMDGGEMPVYQAK